MNKVALALTKENVISVFVIAKSLPTDQFTEHFEIEFTSAKLIESIVLQDVSLKYYNMAGKTTRFDPVLGKNVTEVLTGEEVFDAEIKSIEKRENTLVVKCASIPARNHFVLTIGELELKKADITKTVNPEGDVYTYHTFDNGMVKLNYRLYTPKLVSGQKVPLVLALHGSGESGDRSDYDNNTHLVTSRLGLSFSTEEWQRGHPCYVVMPQFPSLEASYETEEYQKAYMEIIDSLSNVDSNKIYGVTLSMGSRIMYSMLANYPTYFAGVILNCGNPMNALVSNVKDMPIHLIHIETDNIVMTQFSIDTFKQLIKAGNQNARLTLYPFKYVKSKNLPDAHWSWSIAMEEKEKLEWLFSQSKLNSNQGSETGTLKCFDKFGAAKETVIMDDAVYVPLQEISGQMGWEYSQEGNSILLIKGDKNISINTDSWRISQNLDNNVDYQLNFKEIEQELFVEFDFVSKYLEAPVELGW